MSEKITATEASGILKGYDDILLGLQKEWHDISYSFPGARLEECPECGSSLDTALSLDRDAYGRLIRLRQRLGEAIRAYDGMASKESPK